MDTGASGRTHAADNRDAISLRGAGRLHHLKFGAAHARTRVLGIVDEAQATVVALDTARSCHAT